MTKRIFLLFTILCGQIEAQRSKTVDGDRHYALGNYSRAISYYEQEQESPSVAVKIGKGYNALGNYHKAIEAYEKALKKDSTMLLAKYELGKLYLKISKPEKARPLFEKLVQSDAKNPNFHYQLGLIAKQTQDSMALAYFKKAVQLDRRHLKSIYQVTRHYFVELDKDSLFHYADKGLKFDPNNVDLINIKMLYHFTRGFYGEAKEGIEKLMSLGQHSEGLLEKLGDCNFELRQFEKALEAYQQLFELGEATAEIHFKLGRAYSRLNRHEEALKHYKEALKLKDPALTAEYNAIGETYMTMGDDKNAVKYLDKAMDESPKSLLLNYSIIRRIDGRMKDPKIKLHFFLKFKKRFPKARPNILEYVNSRISHYKAEIHLAAE
ncbi:tetratricopeptide repeat protein [Sungkyunkwania multivorans]|uniref:Tetratricopeptide repeat protein n=1 Tax=Sungkyunkwania multivorans TaxID=1173618 RepID=A0ABW3D5J7_9FLAO